MKKTLRFSLLSLLMMICGMTFAQTTVTFDVKTDNVKGQTDVTTLTKDNVTLKIEVGTSQVVQEPLVVTTNIVYTKVIN